MFEAHGNGNPTTYSGNTLTFDPENRMTAFGSTLSGTYRADALRASKTTSSGTSYFLYDGGEPIVEMNGSGTVIALNVFAPDGLVARQTSSSTIEYVLGQQGNVANRTNTSGTVLSTTQYDAWGNEQAISGTPTDPFGYNAEHGYYLDRESGLYLCQHRLYDPANGRWLNRDPIGYEGGTNTYSYCASRPERWVDQSGEQDEIEIGATLAEMAAEDGNPAALGKLAGALLAAGGTGLAALTGDPNLPEQGAGIISTGCEAIGGLLSGLGDSSSASAPTASNVWDGTRPGKIPPGWNEKPAKSGQGTRWVDPDDDYNSVRVDPNDPAFGNPAEHHVHVNVNGTMIDIGPPDGAHIPFGEWEKWPNWYPTIRPPR